MRSRLNHWAATAAIGLAAMAAWAQSPAVVERIDGSLLEADPQELRLVRSDSGLLPFRSDGTETASVVLEEDSEESLPLQEILRIQWHPTETISVTSGPETECHSLGDNLTSSLPADWGELSSHLDWRRAAVPQVYHQWRHLPGAQWVWSGAEWFSIDHRERVLFRQRFDIPEDMRVVTATLQVGVDDTMTLGRLNGVSLPLPEAPQELTTWNVTHAIHPGPNLLALVAHDAPAAPLQSQFANTSGINAAGLAFRIEITGIPGGGASPRPPTCVAHLINGDRISGDLRHLDDSRVSLTTTGGEMELDRDWITELLISTPPPVGRFASLTGEAPRAEPIVFLTPRRVPAWAPGILLGDGTHLSGRILRTEDDGLLVKPRFSDAAHVPLDEIRAVYPDPPADEGYFHYPIQTHATRICRLTSVGGDQFSGLIDELGESVVVNTPEMTTVRLPRSDVLHCVFPMSPRLWAGERIGAEAPLTPRRIDMWGHRRQTSDDLPYRENLIAQINQVTHDLGFSLEWIDDTALVTGQLTPQTAPILLVVDEREAFPLTISSPGDGLAALTDYLREGGVLVLIPAGIPFWHGREWDGQQWNARPLRQQVANDMGFAFLTPGIPRADARAFEIPDNRGETLTFERMSSESPWTLLPTALGFPSLEDSRFRPILPLDTGSPARLEPIYELRTDTGEACGTAMASIIHTGGELSGSRIYHVSPALAQAIDETGEPALHRILPAIIADALAPMDGIPPDSLTPGSGGTVAQP